MPVHLYGQMLPVEVLSALAAGTGITIIEDAAQTQGGDPPRKAGRVDRHRGRDELLSWQASRRIQLRRGRPHRRRRVSGAADERPRGEQKDDQETVGWNSRLDTLQVIVIQAKLADLECLACSSRDAVEADGLAPRAS